MQPRDERREPGLRQPPPPHLIADPFRQALRLVAPAAEPREQVADRDTRHGVSARTRRRRRARSTRRAAGGGPRRGLRWAITDPQGIAHGFPVSPAARGGPDGPRADARRGTRDPRSRRHREPPSRWRCPSRRTRTRRAPTRPGAPGSGRAWPPSSIAPGEFLMEPAWSSSIASSCGRSALVNRRGRDAQAGSIEGPEARPVFDPIRQRLGSLSPRPQPIDEGDDRYRDDRVGPEGLRAVEADHTEQGAEPIDRLAQARRQRAQWHPAALDLLQRRQEISVIRAKPRGPTLAVPRHDLRQLAPVGPRAPPLGPEGVAAELRDRRVVVERTGRLLDRDHRVDDLEALGQGSRRVSLEDAPERDHGRAVVADEPAEERPPVVRPGAAAWPRGRSARRRPRPCPRPRHGRRRGPVRASTSSATWSGSVSQAGLPIAARSTRGASTMRRPSCSSRRISSKAASGRGGRCRASPQLASDVLDVPERLDRVAETSAG